MSASALRGPKWRRKKPKHSSGSGARRTIGSTRRREGCATGILLYVQCSNLMSQRIRQRPKRGWPGSQGKSDVLSSIA
jgi:hypothetical protein